MQDNQVVEDTPQIQQDGGVSTETPIIEVVDTVEVTDETIEEVDLVEELGISKELEDYITELSKTHLVKLTPLEDDKIKLTVLDYSLEDNYHIKELLEKEKEVGSNFILVGNDREVVSKLDEKFKTDANG
jgi:predicted signal transduction protein with EAL and GGDEF domain